jgi:hypothetical protein
MKMVWGEKNEIFGEKKRKECGYAIYHCKILKLQNS